MRLLKREAKVAFSRRVQPIWFRISKWIVFLTLIYRARTRPILRRWIKVLFLAGLGLHLFYRAKTKGWTQPWGGWDDLAAVPQDGRVN
jgi:hypothetical protein